MMKVVVVMVMLSFSLFFPSSLSTAWITQCLLLFLLFLTGFSCTGK